MGVSEVNPVKPATPNTDTSSDSDTDYATEAMETPVCDGTMCVSSEEEPGQNHHHEKRGRKGRKGPGPWLWMRHHPAAWGMHRHAGGPWDMHKPGGPWGMHPPVGPWGMGMGMPPMAGPMMNPMMFGCPEMHRMRHGRGLRRCHSAPGRAGRHAHSPVRRCGFGGPRMRKKFVKFLLSNPEFWRKFGDAKQAEEWKRHGGPTMEQLGEFFSKMNVSKDSEQENESSAAEDTKEKQKRKGKCGKGKGGHGKRCGRKMMMWNQMMKHFYREMNPDAPTASESEGEEGHVHGNKHTEESTQKSPETQKNTAAANDKDSRKVHFGDDVTSEDEMTPGGFPGMFMGFPWGRHRMFHGPHRFHGHHHGHWRRPGHFRGMFMGGDPRMMMHAGPRMWDESSASEGEMRDGCAQRREIREQRKAFRKIAREMGWFPKRRGFSGWFQTDSEPEKSSGEEDNNEEGEKLTDEMREQRREKLEKRKQMASEMHEKRQKFRSVVQELGVQRWMFRVLAQQVWGKASESTEVLTEDNDEQKNNMSKKKEKYMATLSELGAYPWMFKVLANQKRRAALMASDSDQPEGAVGGETEEGSTERRGMRRERRHFRQMAEQMGWLSGTSDTEATTSDGEALTDDEEKQNRRAERFMMKQMMGQMGWMPGMAGGWHGGHYGHHPHHHHHRHHHHDDDHHHHHEHRPHHRHSSRDRHMKHK